jgi:hypothetical protein
MEPKESSSSAPFPGHQYRIDWRQAEGGGNLYYSADLNMEVWLCPALFRYFSDAPMSLYAQVKARAWPWAIKVGQLVLDRRPYSEALALTEPGQEIAK